MRSQLCILPKYQTFMKNEERNNFALSIKSYYLFYDDYDIHNIN